MIRTVVITCTIAFLLLCGVGILFWLDDKPPHHQEERYAHGPGPGRGPGPGFGPPPGEGPPHHGDDPPPFMREGRRRGWRPEHFTEMREKMRDLREENRELAETMEETRRIHIQINDLLEEYHDAEATESEQEAIKEKLTELFSQEFDLELERQRLEVERIESQLTRFRELLAKKENFREELIDKNVEDAIESGTGYFPRQNPQTNRRGFPEDRPRYRYRQMHKEQN